jgi:hypothetical protein
METILLTWTIKPSNKICTIGYKTTSIDPEQRYKQYLAALLFYLTFSKFDNIVFCENSNYEIKDKKLLYDLAKLYNKRLEILHFQWDEEQLIKRRNYGYWDGEIIDYAFLNSELLKDSKNRYKISGRYICTNINNVIEAHKDINNMFYRQIGFALSTWLFKVTNELYKENLYNLKNEIIDNNIEDVYYKRLRQYIWKEEIGNLKTYPNRLIWHTSKAGLFSKKFTILTWLCRFNGIPSIILDKLLFRYANNIKKLNTYIVNSLGLIPKTT